MSLTDILLTLESFAQPGEGFLLAHWGDGSGILAGFVFQLQSDQIALLVDRSAVLIYLSGLNRNGAVADRAD